MLSIFVHNWPSVMRTKSSTTAAERSFLQQSAEIDQLTNIKILRAKYRAKPYPVDNKWAKPTERNVKNS